MDEFFERTQRQSNRAMAGVLLAVVLPCLLGAAWLTARVLWDRYSGEHVMGTVVEIQGDVPALVVEFDAGGGVKRRTESAGSDLNKNYAVGDRLGVWFHPDQPQDARLDLFVENWLFPLLLGVFGGFFALPLLFMSDLRGGAASRRLKSGGSRVMAEYVGVQPTLDFDAFRKLDRNIGSISLDSEDGGRFRLTHNGQPRDPYDPLVARELGLRYVLKAKWKDTRSGIEYFYDSEPLADNPERRYKGRPVPVFIDPDKPQRYRMELGPAGPATRENSVVEG